MKMCKLNIRTNDKGTAFNYNGIALQECGTIKSFVRRKECNYGTDCTKNYCWQTDILG